VHEQLHYPTSRVPDASFLAPGDSAIIARSVSTLFYLRRLPGIPSSEGVDPDIGRQRAARHLQWLEAGISSLPPPPRYSPRPLPLLKLASHQRNPPKGP
jgi:hypothetical protein